MEETPLNGIIVIDERLQDALQDGGSRGAHKLRLHLAAAIHTEDTRSRTQRIGELTRLGASIKVARRMVDLDGVRR